MDFKLAHSLSLMNALKAFLGDSFLIINSYNASVARL